MQLAIDSSLAWDHQNRSNAKHVQVCLSFLPSYFPSSSIPRHIILFASLQSPNSMKHDAIVEQGIPIHERVPIPDELIPEDSRVEIDAKIHAGYCEAHFPAF